MPKKLRFAFDAVLIASCSYLAFGAHSRGDSTSAAFLGACAGILALIVAIEIAVGRRKRE